MARLVAGTSGEGRGGGQFFEKAAKMACYSKGTDSQDSGDFGRGLPLPDPIHYFGFAAGKPRAPGIGKRLSVLIMER